MASFLHQLGHCFSYMDRKYFCTFTIPSMVLCRTKHLLCWYHFRFETNDEILKRGKLLRIIIVLCAEFSCVVIREGVKSKRQNVSCPRKQHQPTCNKLKH